MPCATIHMLTAGRVLDRWETTPSDAPFDVERAPLRAAFLAGAMGPDMGFVPGVDRFVSELSHYVRTGDLARRILREAGTPAQAAFAWGWATHHVTDVEIHPLVGRACGELLRGDRGVRLNSSDDLPTHVAMEVGLDLFFFLGRPGIPRPPRRSPFEPRDLAFLARALEATYDLEWETAPLHRAHRTALVRTARWPWALGVLGRARGFGERLEGLGAAAARLAGWILDAAGRVVERGGAAAGFLDPLPPPAWMVEEVEGVAAGFADRFQAQVRRELDALENRNLETGLPEDADVEHPDSARTLRRLRRLREGAPR